MYKRVIVSVASALFILLALLAAVITDLHDRDFPQTMDVKHRIDLDFSESGYAINESFAMLEALDEQWHLGLIKVAPDLARGGNSQVFVPLNDADLTDKLTWFNGDEGEIVDRDRLANSYPDGEYLIDGKDDHLNNFEQRLKNEGVLVTRADASIFSSLGIVLYERGFFITVLAALMLIVALSLFWLSVRARGRALKVLNGVPTLRIQMQDLAGFGGALFMSAGIVSSVSAVYIGMFHGWEYVGIFLKALISLQGIVIVVSLLASLVMSATAWPSATMLATRQPAVKSFRSASIVIQALTFFLVVVAAGPTWSAYQRSSAMEAEMSQWKQLSDQVAIEFAIDMDQMDQMDQQIGKLVKDAESQDAIALSYTFTEEMESPDSFGEYGSVSFVNQRWLDMVTTHPPNSELTSMTDDSISENIVQFVESYDDIWSREVVSEDGLFERFQFFRPQDDFQMPVMIGGGDGSLDFANDVLLVVVPSIYDTFDDSTLIAMASSANIVFTGASTTQQLLKKYGLDVKTLHSQGLNGEINIAYMAEKGILLAQFASYVVWLQGLALIGLVVAFTLAAAINALITAQLQGKYDFPLRLSGLSWLRIIRNRLTRALLAGIFIVGVVTALQRFEAIWAILIISGYGFLLVLLSHLFAVRWCFYNVCKRRI